jgi:hypothetical protein
VLELTPKETMRCEGRAGPTPVCAYVQCIRVHSEMHTEMHTVRTDQRMYVRTEMDSFSEYIQCARASVPTPFRATRLPSTFTFSSILLSLLSLHPFHPRTTTVNTICPPPPPI